MSPPPPPHTPQIFEKKKKRSIYITYIFEQFCPYKIRLAPINKIFDPFKQNEKAQETFTNLKSQIKQISKPKKLAQQHRLIKKLKKFEHNQPIYQNISPAHKIFETKPI